MAFSGYVSPFKDNVRADGLVLFHSFIHEELESAQLPVDVIEIDSAISREIEDSVVGAAFRAAGLMASGHFNIPEGYNNVQSKETREKLRLLANEFQTSSERKAIRLLSEEVVLGNIDHDAFHNLLNEFFVHGIDKYRIVSLFCFCSDLLLRCARSGFVKLGRQLFVWAQKYFIEIVCDWVYDLGGWEKVFSNTYKFADKISTLAAITGIVVGCSIILKNNLR